VLAEGFIPSRVDVETSVLSLNDCLELSFALVGETIAHAHSKLFDDHFLIWVIDKF
jgi:hypothetical protein